MKIKTGKKLPMTSIRYTLTREESRMYFFFPFLIRRIDRLLFFLSFLFFSFVVVICFGFFLVVFFLGFFWIGGYWKSTLAPAQKLCMLRTILQIFQSQLRRHFLANHIKESIWVLSSSLLVTTAKTFFATVHNKFLKKNFSVKSREKRSKRITLALEIIKSIFLK